jgi:hypothetical protein
MNMRDKAIGETRDNYSALWLNAPDDLRRIVSDYATARLDGNLDKMLELENKAASMPNGRALIEANNAYHAASTQVVNADTAYDAYRRHLGELESRLVQERRDWTPAERRATPPWAMENYIPDDQQIKSFELAPVNPKDILSANRDATAGAIALPAARTEAEAMARQILEMRAAGRAGDVTDAMMAQADPQYMFNNTPLPMDEASRMSRAGEMGLLDPQYHATQSDFQSFMPSETGLTGRGVYTGDEAVDVMDYARSRMSSNEGLNVIPLLSPEGSTYARKLDWERTLDADPELSYNATWEQNVEGMRRAADTMSAQGYPGVHSQPGERVTFNPQSLRSRFARFDPAFSHLANLSAANASPLAGILAMPNEEERNRQLGLLFGGY